MYSQLDCEMWLDILPKEILDLEEMEWENCLREGARFADECCDCWMSEALRDIKYDFSYEMSFL